MTTNGENVLSPLALPGSRYPTGWFVVAWADEIPVGEVKLVHYFGEDIVLWRGMSGQLNAADAYCLHLGANLGVRGTVVGEDIKCPWHGWEWNGEGCNTLIPYSEQRCKPHLRLRTWPVREWHGVVLVWHDRAGGGPTWEVDPIAEFDDPAFYPMGPAIRTVHHVKTHPQLIAENGVDFAHVPYVHGAGQTPTLDSVTFAGHEFFAEVGIVYGAGKQNGTWLTPEGALKTTMSYRMWGIGIGGVGWPAELRRSYMAMGTTPVDDTYCDLFWFMTTERQPGDGDVPEGKAKGFLDHQQHVVTQDFFTWENMKVLHTPNFAPEEAKHYAALRRWAWQFYPDVSAPVEIPERIPVPLDEVRA